MSRTERWEMPNVPGGRPFDPGRRERVLAMATDYVLEHGLAGVSLRPLAAALNTSTRMLLYDFGSKEDLVMAVLAEARRREAAMLATSLPPGPTGSAELIRGVWDWISHPEREPFLRLFFQVYVDAMINPYVYRGQGRAMVTDWVDSISAAFTGPTDDPASPTMVIAVIRGLLLDRLATGDHDRTNQALARFSELL